MTAIVHLSDTHFGTEVGPVVDALHSAVRSLRPDLVVISGDITQRAKPREFAAARNFLNALPVPAALVAPGNHDIPLFNLLARAFSPYRNFRRAFGDRFGNWTGNGTTVLAIDTTNPLRHTRGRLEVSRFGEQVAAARQAGPSVLIAAIHQPLHTAWAQDLDEVLMNAPLAAEAFAGAEVDLVLSGHVHVPVLTTTRDIFPGLRRHFILAGAGTAISRRTRPGAPNSFNLVLSPGLNERRRIEVVEYAYRQEMNDFAEKTRSGFVQAGDGWRGD